MAEVGAASRYECRLGMGEVCQQTATCKPYIEKSHCLRWLRSASFQKALVATDAHGGLDNAPSTVLTVCQQLRKMVLGSSF